MGLIRTLHRFLVRQTMPSLAVDYCERMNNAILDFYLRPMAEEINKEFSRGIRILDVGTGTGHLPVLLAQGNSRHQATGLDLSGRCIRSAQTRANQAGVHERVRFVCGKVSDLQERFDLIVSTCSLHHWRYPMEMLKRMAGLLNTNGQIWLLDDSGDASEDARKEWVRRVESSFDAGVLFRMIFNFESKHLAYKQEEIPALCMKAGLSLTDFQVRDVFFMAKCAPNQ